MSTLQTLILWISLYWLAITLVAVIAGIVDALAHRRRKSSPRKPTPPTLPTKPWNGHVLPPVNVRSLPEYRSPQQDFLDRWREEQSLVANPEIGEEREWGRRRVLSDIDAALTEIATGTYPRYGELRRIK